jgi:hypothetical protein
MPQDEPRPTVKPKPTAVDAPERRKAAQPRRGRVRERGAALILLVISIALLAAGAAASLFTSSAVVAMTDGATANALGFARDALISYATSRGGLTGTARPGEFPCPDTNNDGREDLNPSSVPADACMAGLGRIPWITLGIPEPKDGAGETLWYAVGLPFRNSASNSTPINSNTLGNLTVRMGGAATPATTQAVAVVLAPGAVLPTQNRSATGTMVCGGTSVAPNVCASNYLEAYGGADNRVENGPFVSVSASGVAGFNDRLTYIRTTDFMPAVEQRVGGELQNLVEDYRNAAKLYPWAADFGLFTGASVKGLSRGRFPVTAEPYNWNTVVTVGTSTFVTPRLPDWIQANHWHNVVYYSAGKQQLDSTFACATCSSSPALSVVDGGVTTSVSAVLLTPGTPADGVARPSTSLSSYFESTQNTHAGLTCSGTSVNTACDVYAAPPAIGHTPSGIEIPLLDRDRIFTVTTDPLPVTPPPVELTKCQTAAGSLASIARSTTCGGPGNSVIPACKVVVTQLGNCGCKAAANTMIKPPCYNVSNNANPPKQCTSALTQLDTCIK